MHRLSCPCTNMVLSLRSAFQALKMSVNTLYVSEDLFVEPEKSQQHQEKISYWTLNLDGSWTAEELLLHYRAGMASQAI